MKKEDLKQIKEVIENVVDQRIITTENKIDKQFTVFEKKINTHTDRKIDEKIDGLARSVNNSFGKLETRVDGIENRFDDLEEKVDDNLMTLGRIERQMRAESETLDKHDVRLKVIEKARY